MSDFTMCVTQGCPKAARCRRHSMSSVIPHECAQSWYAFNLEDCNDPQGDTGAFWPLFGTQGEIR